MQRVITTEDRDARESAVARSQLVGAVVVTMADFGFTADELANAMSCTISIHQAGVNFLCTGDPPTVLLGIPLASGSTAIVTGNTDINNLQFIAQAAQANLTIVLEWNLVGLGM